MSPDWMVVISRSGAKTLNVLYGQESKSSMYITSSPVGDF